jgi:hypothetical protein
VKIFLPMVLPFILISHVCMGQGITLKDYVDTRFMAVDKSIALSKEVMDQRLELLNELRRVVNDDRESFLTKESYDLRHGQLERDISDMRVQIARIESEMVTWISAMGIFLLLVTIVVQYIGIRYSKNICAEDKTNPSGNGK